MAKYKDFAHRIGFSMLRLSAIMGYNRAALYKILSHELGFVESRWADAVGTAETEE